MKKILLCVCTALLCSGAFAANKYVSVGGTGDGSSWATAQGSITDAVNGCTAGDTVFVSAGTYTGQVVITDGVSVLGGYNAATGERDFLRHASILDGGEETIPLNGYSTTANHPTLIEGFTVQNGFHKYEGAGVIIRSANVTLANCTIQNCIGNSSGGGIYNAGGTIKDCYITKCEGHYGGGIYNKGGLVTGCTIELCTTDSRAGGIYLEGGVAENCIIRGNAGKYGGGVCIYAQGVLRNCVVHNNGTSTESWPNSGGCYNPEGTIANCVFACNYGTQYAGIHSDGKAVNVITWGNKADDGFADPVNYIGSAGLNNASDNGFSPAHSAMKLNVSNSAADGPQFLAPTTFAGVPTTDAEIAVMRSSDWRLEKTSPCIDKGIADALVPAYDLLGVTRPQGTAVDLGAYEYDPNAKVVAVTDLKLTPETLRIVEEQSDWLTPIISPVDATDKSVTWTSSDPTIATVANGLVTGVKVGTVTITAKTVDGGFTASSTVIVDEKPIVIIHPDVLAADELKAEDYAIPSYIPMLVAKEAARADSSSVNLQALKDAIAALQPKETPHSVVATINGDPTTRMAFTWYTGAGVAAGKVQLVAKAVATEADFASPIELTATATDVKNMRYAVSTSGILKSTALPAKTAFDYTSHKAIATELTPNTTYSYRVGTADHWSDIKTFTTAATGKESFSFLYMTDSHIMDSTYVEEARWASITAAKHASDAKFLLFTGDFVETGTEANSEWEWEQWFNVSMREALDVFPVAPTDGNHDDSPNLNYTHHFNTDNAFYKEAKVKPQFEGITYSFVYGDALFLIYSHQDYWRGDYDYAAGTSTYLTNDVANWFRQEVAAHPEVKWRIAAVHKNLFTGSGHQEDEDGFLFRSVLLPVFDELNMDLIIQGHDHTYEVMGPIDNLTKTLVPGSVSDVKTVEVNTNTNRKGLEGGTFNVTDGTMYFVNGTCGHKRYYPLSKEEMEANIDLHKVENYWDLFTGRFGQPGAPSFSHITVSTDQIEVKTYTGDKDANATLFDAWKIVKPTQETAVEDVTIEETNVRKVFENGQLIIIRDNVRYNVLGTQL